MEEVAIDKHFIDKEQASIASLVHSIEWEWIKTRQNVYFSQLRSYIIQKREEIGIISYDCRSEVESSYCFHFGSYGNKEDETGYYQLFSVDSPPFSSDSFMEKSLSIGVCKVGFLPIF